MADIQVTGLISTIKYIENAVLVYVDEYKKGYKRQDGAIVDDKYVSWKVIFKDGLKNYISKFFGNGMLVTIKGEAMPYAIEKNAVVEGYSFIGQCINRASYPRAAARAEHKMIKESLEHSNGTPDIDAYNQPDF